MLLASACPLTQFKTHAHSHGGKADNCAAYTARSLTVGRCAVWLLVPSLRHAGQERTSGQRSQFLPRTTPRKNTAIESANACRSDVHRAPLPRQASAEDTIHALADGGRAVRFLLRASAKITLKSPSPTASKPAIGDTDKAQATPPPAAWHPLTPWPCRAGSLTLAALHVQHGVSHRSWGAGFHVRRLGAVAPRTPVLCRADRRAVKSI